MHYKLATFYTGQKYCHWTTHLSEKVLDLKVSIICINQVLQTSLRVVNNCYCRMSQSECNVVSSSSISRDITDEYCTAVKVVVQWVVGCSFFSLKKLAQLIGVRQLTDSVVCAVLLIVTSLKDENCQKLVSWLINFQFFISFQL